MLAEWKALRPLGLPRDTHTIRDVSSVIHLCMSLAAEHGSVSDISSKHAPSLRAYSCSNIPKSQYALEVSTTSIVLYLFTWLLYL